MLVKFNVKNVQLNFQSKTSQSEIWLAVHIRGSLCFNGTFG